MGSSFLDQLQKEYEKHPKVRTRKAWGEFISRWPWEWFVTLTFTEDTHEERALKLFKLWKSKLNKDLFGPRWYKRPPHGVIWVAATEYQKSGRIHLHILIAGVGNTRRLDWMDKWFDIDKLAGFPRIFPVQNQEAVSNYVTKYVTKDGNVLLSDNLKDISSDLIALAAGLNMAKASEREAPDVDGDKRR